MYLNCRHQCLRTIIADPISRQVERGQTASGFESQRVGECSGTNIRNLTNIKDGQMKVNWPCILKVMMFH
jgi:hypothetical protein